MSNIVNARHIQRSTLRHSKRQRITGSPAIQFCRVGVPDSFHMIPQRAAIQTVRLSDPTIHEDCLELLSELMPLSKRYRHSYEGAQNATAHLATMMLFGESTWVAIRDGRPDLGTWQRLFLVELFEPRSRTVDLAILGE